MKKQFVIYMATAFGLAWILEIIASIFSNNGNQMVFTGIMAIAMFMPFLGVIVARIPLKGMGWIPHLKGKIRYVFFALWIPALLSLLGGGLFFLIFPGTFDSEFLTLRGLLEEAGAAEQFEAQGITIPMYLLITSIQAVTIVPFINMFVEHNLSLVFQQELLHTYWKFSPFPYDFSFRSYNDHPKLNK